MKNLVKSLKLLVIKVQYLVFLISFSGSDGKK